MEYNILKCGIFICRTVLERGLLLKRFWFFIFKYKYGLFLIENKVFFKRKLIVLILFFDNFINN